MAPTIHTPHNWPIYGHDWAVDHLRRAVANDRTRHAYLLTGVDNIGKLTLAYAFAMALNAPAPGDPGNIDHDSRTARKIMSGNHPDIVLTERDDKTGALKIAAVRDLTAKLALKPYEARYRVAVLDDFQFARPQAQDALLKTLEEPAATSVLLVLANSTDKILSTITSRCQVLNLRPASVAVVQQVLETEHGLPPAEAELMARVSGGRLGWAIDAATEGSPKMQQRAEALNMLETLLGQGRAGRFDLAEGLGKEKLAVYPLLELWITYWRDVLLRCVGGDVSLTNIDREAAIAGLAGQVTTQQAAHALAATRDALRTLTQTNTNARLVLEVMFLDYPGL